MVASAWPVRVRALPPRFASQTEAGGTGAPIDLLANLDMGAHRFGGTPNLNMGAPSVEISEKSVGGAPAFGFRPAKSAGAGVSWGEVRKGGVPPSEDSGGGRVV